jgi:hypothetical protein
MRLTPLNIAKCGSLTIAMSAANYKKSFLTSTPGLRASKPFTSATRCSTSRPFISGAACPNVDSTSRPFWRKSLKKRRGGLLEWSRGRTSSSSKICSGGRPHLEEDSFVSKQSIQVITNGETDSMRH